VWHASVAVLLPTGDGAIPTGDLTRGARRVAAAYARELLAGVGAGETIEERKQIALHARRSLSDYELRAIDPVWLAIEPIDMG
jgi:hypothetical protein